MLNNRLQTDMEWMLGICLHQSNQLFPPPFNHIHPYTCGEDSRHTILFPLINSGRRILVCPDCGYLQDCGESKEVQNVE